MVKKIDDIFDEWVGGLGFDEARICIFDNIRDIPYAVIPELNEKDQYIRILELNKGSCTPKHFLLCNLYQRLGLQVLYSVFPFRWDEFEYLYPAKLKRLARDMPPANHLACKVEIDEKLVLVDATLDPALAAVGLPINTGWDGRKDTSLPVVPCGDEQLYHPSEAHLMPTGQVDESSLSFYDGLNKWMESLRRKEMDTRTPY